MNEKRWLGLIVGLYVILAFMYSVLMPPWEAPDEPAHYVLALNLARIGVFSSLERNYEGGQPQTYYRLASVPLKWLFDRDPDWVAAIRPKADYGNVRKPAPIFAWSDENYQFLPGLYLLRWLNILVGLAALGLTYAGIKGFVGPGRVALAALGLAALTPQFLHTSSSVANDTLGVLAGALLFWLASRVVLQRVPFWELSGTLILAFLLPYLTKLTVLPVGIAVGIAVVWSIRERYPDRWGRLAVGGLVLGAGFLALGLWVFPEMGQLFLRQIGFRALTLDESTLTLETFGGMLSQVIWSYWGLVGWLAVGLPGWLVWLLTALAVAGIFMGMIGNWRQTKSGAGGAEERSGMWVVWLIAGLTLAAVLKNGLNTPNTQGRFLFPAMGALALAMVTGWERLLPARLRPYLLPAVIGSMLVANLILWFGGVIPVYYQLLLD